MLNGNKNNKKLKLPIKRIWDDNIFMLKLIHSASPGLLAISIITIVMQALAEFVSSTLILQYTLNSIERGKRFEEIVQLVLIWMIIHVIIALIRAFYDEKVYKVRIMDVKKNVYNRVYQKAASVELGCYENPAYYDDFVKAIDECGIRADELIVDVRNLVYLCISLLANVTLIATINPLLIVFAIFPLMMSFLQVKANKINYQKTMKIKEENRKKDYTRRVFYLADYAKEMRLTEMSGLMLTGFRESGARVIDILKKYGLSYASLRYIVSECRYTIAPLGATFYAVWQAFVNKSIGYGDCLVIVNSIDRVSSVLSKSSNELLKFQENAFYIENLRKFLDYEPKIKGGKDILPEEGDIVLENISFRYDGASKDTLQNVTMRFGAKEKIAIVGHNGAGKTTLVKLLLRLYDVAGAITYGGKDIKDYKLDAYRGMFAAVMQDFHVFALSVAENVTLDVCKKSEAEEIKSALSKSGLSIKIAGFPKGIDTRMTKEFDETGVQFSGGEQQKLAISHVYYKKNRFVILDEPSSALDPIAEYEMYDRMMEACKDCGMIFISHRLSSAVLADRIYFMENGRVLESGTHSELMKQNGKYAEMFRRQALNYVEG